MNIKPVQVLVAGGALSAGVLALGAWLTTSELNARRAARRALEVRLALGADLREELVSRRAALESALVRHARAASGAEMRLAPASALNETLARLAALAAESGLEVMSMAPGAAGSKPFYTGIPVALRARGRFPDVPKFLAVLHEGMPDLCVLAFSLDAQDQSGVLGVTLSMEWRAAPDDSAARAGAAGD